MTDPAAAGPPRSSWLLPAALLTAAAGAAMSFQGRANGALAGISGHGIFSAFVSFAVGLSILLVVQLCSPASRKAFGTIVTAVTSRQIPVWMILGGIGGASVVVAQSLTVPVMGVAMFTMSFVCGQLTGAMIVDCTDLPPGGRSGLSLNRVAGVVVVVAGVSLSAVERLEGGVPFWAPLLPGIAGLLTAFQQACNGRIRQLADSAVAATTMNFLIGSLFLAGCVAVVVGSGRPWQGWPEMPAESWMLIGGALGVMFIGLTTVTVAHLGVLLLTMLSLFGNLLGSLLLDLLFPAPGSHVSVMTIASVLVVLCGVGLSALPARRRR